MILSGSCLLFVSWALPCHSSEFFSYRSQKKLGSADERTLPNSSVDNLATKRQKLEAGYLSKVHKLLIFFYFMAWQFYMFIRVVVLHVADLVMARVLISIEILIYLYYGGINFCSELANVASSKWLAS